VLVGKDTATVEYVESVVANPNGKAMDADRDSIFRQGLLVKSDNGWRVIRVGAAARDTSAR